MCFCFCRFIFQVTIKRGSVIFIMKCPLGSSPLLLASLHSSAMLCGSQAWSPREPQACCRGSPLAYTPCRQTVFIGAAENPLRTGQQREPWGGKELTLPYLPDGITLFPAPSFITQGSCLQSGLLPSSILLEVRILRSRAHPLRNSRSETQLSVCINKPSR